MSEYRKVVLFFFIFAQDIGFDFPLVNHINI